MAWDKERPYAPFTVFPKNSIAYEMGERVRMESFSYLTLSKDGIDRVWNNCGATYRELCGKDGWDSLEFRPFKNVLLELTYETYGRGRSGITFYWRDTGKTQYPMFATEIDRLIKSGIISNKITGLWSAEKRGQNYGIRLEKPLVRNT